MAREYWERWEKELEEVMAREERDEMKKHELNMCQQALLVS
jgi:hypothetical protein